MCGIGGFLGNYGKPLLERMVGVLHHRGPDDRGVLYRPDLELGFCHTRLAIIDLSSAGHQPYVDEQGRAALVFNGEIYNYRELRLALEQRGETFYSDSDTEVLLKAYLVFGPSFLERLNGIFAFAIYDYSQRRLTLGRDHFGVKPLYYARTRNGFVFASEMKGLFVVPDVSRDLDFEAVRSHLIFLWAPGEQTVARSVRKLEPGTLLQVTAGGVVQKQHYFHPPSGLEQASMPVGEAIESVREALSRAVARQMVADVEVGAFLSGGLDSSAVVALARGHMDGRKMRCFTLGYSGRDAKSAGITLDLPYARKVAKALDVELSVAEVGADIVDRVPEMIFHLEEPMGDPAALGTFIIAELARERGLKVMLSGMGGDEVFAGYRRHAALMLEAYWQWLPRIARLGLRSASRSLRYRGAYTRRIRKAFEYADRSGELRLMSYMFWMNPDLVNDTLTSHAVAQSEGESGIAAMREGLLRDCPRPSSRIDQALYLDQRHFLADHNLIYTDKMAMATGVEVRVPFLDRDLVATAARIPSKFKQRRHVGKWVLKKAVEPYVPAEAIYRSKTGFGLPLRAWLVGPMREMVHDYLSPRRIRHRGIFDPGSVQRMLADNERGVVDAAFPIFTVLCMELWCETFQDGAWGRSENAGRAFTNSR